MDRTEAAVARERALIGSTMKIRFYPLVVAGGEGVHLIDPDGRRYLDFIASGGVAQTGYGHPKVRAAIDGSWTTMHCCFPHERASDLAERLIALLPGDFPKKAWFGATGSDANDLLVKLLPLATGRPRLVSFIGSYHGQTMGSAALSGHSAQGGSPGATNIAKVPFPDPYRGSEMESLAQLTKELKCGDVAAVIVEPVQSDGGDLVPPPDFFRAVRELCDRYGTWLVFDEVKTGLGRTGRMFGFEHYGVVPDAISLGKPLGGGLPLSAVVGRAELLDQSTLHLFTLGGAPAPCAAGLAVLDAIEEDGLLAAAAARGAQLLDGLRALQERHPIVGHVRGLGLIAGMELVSDRLTKTPDATAAARLVYRCYQLGLVTLYTGLSSNVIEFTPPLVVTERDVADALAILDQALADIQDGRFDDRLLDGFTGW